MGHTSVTISASSFAALLIINQTEHERVSKPLAFAKSALEQDR